MASPYILSMPAKSPGPFEKSGLYPQLRRTKSMIDTAEKPDIQDETWWMNVMRPPPSYVARRRSLPHGLEPPDLDSLSLGSLSHTSDSSTEPSTEENDVQMELDISSSLIQTPPTSPSHLGFENYKRSRDLTTTTTITTTTTPIPEAPSDDIIMSIFDPKPPRGYKTLHKSPGCMLGKRQRVDLGDGFSENEAQPTRVSIKRRNMRKDADLGKLECQGDGTVRKWE